MTGPEPLTAASILGPHSLYPDAEAWTRVDEALKALAKLRHLHHEQQRTIREQSEELDEAVAFRKSREQELGDRIAEKDREIERLRRMQKDERQLVERSIYGILGREPRHGYDVIAEVGAALNKARAEVEFWRHLSGERTRQRNDLEAENAALKQEVERLRAVPYDRGPDGEPGPPSIGAYVDLEAENAALKQRVAEWEERYDTERRDGWVRVRQAHWESVIEKLKGLEDEC